MIMSVVALVMLIETNSSNNQIISSITKVLNPFPRSFLSIPGSKGAGMQERSVGIPISDEMIEKSIRTMTSFIAINILASKVESTLLPLPHAADVAPTTPEPAATTVRKSEVSATVARSRGKSAGKSKESRADFAQKKVMIAMVVMHTYILLSAHTYIHTYIHTPIYIYIGKNKSTYIHSLNEK